MSDIAAVTAAPATAAPAATAAAPAAPDAGTTTAAPAASAAPAAAPVAAPSLDGALAEVFGKPVEPTDGAGAGGDPFAALLGQVPEKYHVKGEGDKVDAPATLAKALEARAALEQRLGTGDVRPKTAEEYSFTPPEQFKDLEFKTERMDAFRSKFHELGGSQALYEHVMTSYINGAGDLMDGVAKLKAGEVRQELQKAWPVQTEYDANMGHAQRAIKALPDALQGDMIDLVYNPVAMRVFAHLGQQMREDAPPAQATGGGGARLVPADQLPADQRAAYANPKHPQHAAIKAQVDAYWAKQPGSDVPI